MDLIDRGIINLLCENGRRSNVDMARELNVSEGTVRKRVDRLISSGALRIVGVVDPAAAGYDTRAVICLTVEPTQVEEASRLLRDAPETVHVYWVTGEHDFVIDAVFESDRHLMSFLTERLSSIPGIVNSKTAHVLSLQKCSYEWILPRPSSLSVLIVDDDPDFVEAARLVLEGEGYDVRGASSGQEALRLMETLPPDVVILDIMMDGVLDGWDATWRIRSSPALRDTPILAVSSITASDYLSMFPTDEDNLIDHFLSKPVRPERLVAEVRRLLGAS
jgi:Lrp/AsnC family transcriptional regulator for asnA, asnC and gidA